MCICSYTDTSSCCRTLFLLSCFAFLGRRSPPLRPACKFASLWVHLRSCDSVVYRVVFRCVLLSCLYPFLLFLIFVEFFYFFIFSFVPFSFFSFRICFIFSCLRCTYDVPQGSQQPLCIICIYSYLVSWCTYLLHCTLHFFNLIFVCFGAFPVTTTNHRLFLGGWVTGINPLWTEKNTSLISSILFPEFVEPII